MVYLYRSDNMADKIVKGIVGSLGSFIAIPFMKEIIVFIISMFPILELRGGLVVAALFKINIWKAIALCIVLVIVLTKVSTNRLKGAAASGNTLMYHYASYWNVHISNCYLVVPVKIFNNSGNVLNITGAKLTDKDNKTYKSISYSKEIGKAQWQNVTYKFPIVYYK